MHDRLSTILSKFSQLERVPGTIMLDALYQWATNPTGSTAAITKGYPPGHRLIKSNLRLRYDLSEEQAEKCYTQLKTEIDTSGLDFRSGYLEAGAGIKAHFSRNHILRDSVQKRLNTAVPHVQHVAWLFSKVKGNHGLSPAGSGGNSFAALIDATFATPVTNLRQDVIQPLIRLGFLNELEWVTARQKLHDHLVFPDYLEPVASNIDQYVSLPELPDFKKLVDALFDRKRARALAGFEEVLHGTGGSPAPGIATESETTREIIRQPFLIGRSESVLAINPRIHDDVKSYLFKAKARTMDIQNHLRRALDELYELHYPDMSFREVDAIPGAIAWEITTTDRSLAAKDILLILTPWLTMPQIETLYNARSSKFVAILTTMMGIPEIDMVFTSVYGRDVLGIDWAVIDVTREPFAERIGTFKPRLLAELMGKLGCQTDGGDEAPAGEQEPKRGEDAGRRVPETETEKAADTDNAEGGGKLEVFLGYSDEGHKVCWSPGKSNNGHLIIVGGSGAGKTELIRCIGSELACHDFPVLMIDFHGDMAPSGSSVTTYDIREGSDYYFNPLELDPRFPDITPLRANSDFRDAIFINFPGLGIQQRDRLNDIIKRGYEAAGITSAHATWSTELLFENVQRDIQDSDDKTTQALRAYLSNIFDYQLFCGSIKLSVGDILDGGITHLNLKGLPENLRALYADLFLRKLYYAMQANREIPRGDISDVDRFRIFVIVDEAKLLVSEKQGVKAVLNKYASELRKFGGGLILASQLLDHFNKQLLANIAAKVCMNAETEEQARSNGKFFGVDETVLKNLEPGRGFLLTRETTTELLVVPSWDR